MAAKDTFILNASYLDAIEDLSDAQRGVLFTALLMYQKNAEYIINDPQVKTAFKFIKIQIDDYNRKYIEKCEKNKQIAIKREAKKKSTIVHERAQSYTDVHLNDNDNDNDHDNDHDSDNDNIEKSPKGDKKKRIFIAPTFQDVEAYCLERGNGIDAQNFVDFYQSKGWRVGNSPMKDWRAAVRTWEQRNKQKNAPTTQTNSPQLNISLGVGEYIDNNGKRRYSPNLPPVPMDAPPRPSNDLVWSKETNTWIPPLC